MLAPGAKCITVTPLAAHGGSIPPLVAGPASRVSLDVEPGYGRVRYELDGHPVAIEGRRLEIGRRADYAHLVNSLTTSPASAGCAAAA